MPRGSYLQTNFSAGELSSDTDTRVDVEAISNGSSIIENFTIFVQGILFRRKGFQFIEEVKDSTKKTILIKFQFSVTQSYIIEAGDLYFRFFFNKARVLEDDLTTIHEIVTVSTTADLFNMKFVQKDDIMYIVDGVHFLQKLIRVKNNDWQIANADLLRGPYIDENLVNADLLTLTGGAPWDEGSTLTLTASGGHTPFLSTHVNALFKLRSGSSDIAHVRITSFTNSTIVTVITQNDVPVSLQGAAVSTWSEGAFSDVQGHPNGIMLHEQRLVLIKDQKKFFSKSGNFEIFEVGTQEDDAFNREVAALGGDQLLWLFSDDVLFSGTSSGVWRAKNSANSAALSNTDISLKRNISFGSSSIQPVIVGDVVFYVQRGLQKIRAIGFSIDKDKFSSSDITIRNDKILGEGIAQIDSQQDPISTLIGVRLDGQLALLTFESEQSVFAWSRSITQGLFESIAIIPSGGTFDEIYAVVNRTINGVTKRYIEVQEPNTKLDDINFIFVDSSLTYNGTQSSTLTFDSGAGSFQLVTQDDQNLTTEDDLLFITEEESVTMTSSLPIFSAGDVGKEIHELREFGKGRALIISFISDTMVVVDVIEDFSLTTLLSNQWAIAIKTITGLEHLEGKSVSISSDSATVPEEVVDENGEIVIDFAGSIIHVGLSYTSRWRNLPLSVPTLNAALGSTLMKDKRVESLIIRFANSGGGIIVDGDNNKIPIPNRSFNDLMNRAPPLFNGDRTVHFAGNWGNEGLVEFTQSDPQPVTMKGITYYVGVEDKI